MEEIQVSQTGCFLLQIFFSFFNCTCKGLQGGTLCGHVFCNVLKRVKKKQKTAVVKKCVFWNLSTFALIVLLKSIQSQFKGKGKQNTGEPDRLFFFADVHFNLKSANARACKEVPFVHLFSCTF